MISEEDLFVIVVLFLKLQNSSVVLIDINTKTLTYSSYSALCARLHHAVDCTCTTCFRNLALQATRLPSLFDSPAGQSRRLPLFADYSRAPI